MADTQYDLLIAGAGGHGTVVAEMARMLGYTRIGMFDEATPYRPLPHYVDFLGVYDAELQSGTPVVIAIGNNEVRERLSQLICHPFATLVHPSAIVAPSVQFGAGTVVLAGAIIQANTVIGAHNLLNAGVVIDHDVQTGAYVHIRPQAYIGSHATLSAKLTIDPGRVVERFCNL